MKRALALFAIGLCAACADGGASDPDAGGDRGRPYTSFAPRDVDPARPLPLVVLLHGYMFSGAVEDAYLNLSRLVDSEQFLLATPDGTLDLGGKRFWNAGPACCNFYGSSVDDVAYVAHVVADMRARYPVDPRRIVLFGHSNGAFMAYRAACELSDMVTAVVALAGMATECTPAEPVSVLHIHGTADTIIGYLGGLVPGATALYPSARASVDAWAENDGCDAAPASGEPLDLDGLIASAETAPLRFGGCARGAAVELWSIAGGGHLPIFDVSAMPRVLAWIRAHPRD